MEQKDDMISSEVLGYSSVATVSVEEEMNLPVFSETAVSALNERSLTSQKLGLILDETSSHILSHGDTTTKREYEKFVKAMVQMYPNLDFLSPHSKEKQWVSLKYRSHYLFSLCRVKCLEKYD